MTQSSAVLVNKTSPHPPETNLAVQRCCAARDRSLEQSRAQNLGEYKAKDKAEEAYLTAMPILSGYENIRDYIACVSFGVLIGYISPIESPGFLYAAQVAISALRLAPKDPKEPPVRDPHPPLTTGNQTK